MNYGKNVGTVALALALLCSACSNDNSSSSNSGGSTKGGSSSGGQSGSSSSSSGSGGQASSSSKGGSGGSQSSSSGTKPACDATNVAACGGDVIGSWDVTSGCLNLSGDFVTRGTGLGCDTAKVTGSVKVTGSFVATADNKKFKDNTATKGDVVVTLDHQCLWMSGTWTQCDLISVAIEGLGFKNVKCADAADGGCNCPAQIDNAGQMGLIVADPQVDGDYTTSGNTLNVGQNGLTGAELEYSYCVASNKLTLTPKTASPPMTGTIVLQKNGGTGGSGGNSGGTGGKATGGTSGSGGKGGSAGGTTTSGGTTTPGSSSGKGGTTVTGGTTASGGATGGATATGGGGGGSTGDDLPCDILENAKTPCVGAYSMVRAIYKSYKGPAYQVRSKSNTSSTKDVTLLDDGYADSKIQDDFCSGGCTVSKIYDQSPKGNHLALSPNTFWLVLAPATPKSGGGINQKEADVKNNPKINAGGHPVYGLKFMGGQGNAYRVLKPTGTAVADEPEYMYAIFDATVYNGQCCNDFGSAETTGNPDSFTSMEAIYYGNATMWGKGGGNGPWFSCDYEATISPGASKVDNNIPSFPYNTIKLATFIIKGFSGGKIALKYGDATKGALTTQYDGARADGVKTMKKQGSIILGTGGDGSAWSTGVWYEGAITTGCSSDKAVDDALQTSIVAAKFAP
jgi:non-reducing end alpha-L-arabinofuranosidase